LSLDKCCEYFDIELNHHNAESDTKACFELFKRFYNGRKKEIETSIDFIC